MLSPARYTHYTCETREDYDSIVKSYRQRTLTVLGLIKRRHKIPDQRQRQRKTCWCHPQPQSSSCIRGHVQTRQAVSRYVTTYVTVLIFTRGSTSYSSLLMIPSTGPSNRLKPSRPSFATLTSVLLTMLACRGLSSSNANSPK